jgi:hypothetical protein
MEWWASRMRAWASFYRLFYSKVLPVMFHGSPRAADRVKRAVVAKYHVRIVHFYWS